MNPPPHHFAATIAQVVATVRPSMSLEETLDSIVRAAAHTVPGYHVGISVTDDDGTITTRAGTHPLVWDLDALQYDLQEGPCYDAIRGETITVVNHARHDQRWPTYLAEAAATGLRSLLGVGLSNNEAALGGLSLYSTESDTVSTEVVLAAQMFATHATLALGRTREVGQLQESLETRRLIDRAVGIVMERHRLTDEHALDFLVRVSEQGAVALRSVAEGFVGTVNANSHRAGLPADRGRDERPANHRSASGRTLDAAAPQH